MHSAVQCKLSARASSGHRRSKELGRVSSVSRDSRLSARRRCSVRCHQRRKELGYVVSAPRDLASACETPLFSQFVVSAAGRRRALVLRSWLRRRERPGRSGGLQRRARTREASISEA